MRIHRCPRCRAEDISADAHPTRILRGGEVIPVFVCRTCYRAAELEFRIACETQSLPYAPLPIREALRRLALFYRERLDEWSAPDRLLEGAERDAATAPIRAALAEIERRLAVDAVD